MKYPYMVSDPELAGKVLAKAPEAVIDVMMGLGEEAWLVGGCVRDSLIGRPVRDWDIATPLRPEDVMRRFEHVIPTGIAYGTVTVVYRGQNVEVTTFRRDGHYSDGRRPDAVEYTDDLREDLVRRDFTMNAVAVDPRAGGCLVLDAVGGVRDIQERTIRAVGDPRARFQEDGLRLFRAVRFATELEWQIEEATRASIMASVEFAKPVALERIRDEFVKLLLANRPGRGISMLRHSGLLPYVLKDLVDCVGCEQNRHHLFDVYSHSLAALDFLLMAHPAASLRLRLATLLHDIGKPATKGTVAEGPYKGEMSFIGHEDRGAGLTQEALRRLRFPEEDVEWVRTLVWNHMFSCPGNARDATVRRLIRRIGSERLDDQFALRVADTLAHGFGVDRTQEMAALRARVDEILTRKDPLSVKMLAVNGHDVMEALGIGPGRDVGCVLRALLDAVIEDPSRNGRKQLLEMAHSIREAG